MPVVSFRLSDDEQARLERHGIDSPGLVARRLLLEELGDDEAREALARLEERRQEPSQPVSETLREIRDGR